MFNALQRIDWYKQRWQIEVYFKVLKSGAKAEQVRLATKDRLLRYCFTECDCLGTLLVDAHELARPGGRVHAGLTRT